MLKWMIKEREQEAQESAVCKIRLSGAEKQRAGQELDAMLLLPNAFSQAE